MAINPVTLFTAARQAAIEAQAIVSGAVVNNRLILTRNNGQTIDAGYVKGDPGTMTQAQLDASINALLDTTGTPAALGTAARGTSTKAAHADHVHPKDVGAAINTSSGITIGPGMVNAGEGLEAHRRYNIVTLRIYVQCSTAGGTICTVPVGWRPTMPIRFNMDTGTNIGQSRSFLISVAGVVTIEGGLTAGQLAFGSVTYICSDT